MLKNTKKSYKKVIILVIFAVVAGSFVSLVTIGIIPLSKFRTINYDNGNGARFSLQFYTKHTIKNVAQNILISSNSNVSPNVKELVSNVSVNAKAPLTLWIESAKSTDASFSTNDCTRNNLLRAFDARINFINQIVTVCVINQQGKELSYLATFHDSNKGYLVYFSQDVDVQKLLSSPENAHGDLTKVGLSDYIYDVSTILASIKPIN